MPCLPSLGQSPSALAAPPETARARDLGVPFTGDPGPLNAITDVKGVEVGHRTLIEGSSVRTGVTAVLPLGKSFPRRVFAGWFALNGNGEMTGTTWITESGQLEGPVMITNTHSVGAVMDAVVKWSLRHETVPGAFSLPVVGETWDGRLNDINGFHVGPEDVDAALDTASTGPVAEGNVGGGTGMVAYRFKGGIGTASRVLEAEEGGYTIGVLVQANFGLRQRLRIAGVPVGREIPDLMPERGKTEGREGSIIVVIATDAPVLPFQLNRIAKRAALGLGRNGSIAANSSGDIFLAFTTADTKSIAPLENDDLSPIFLASVRATEEAIVNALVAARTMTGVNGNKVHALPHHRLREVLGKYNRLAPKEGQSSL